jgi:hypothetical protein
VSWAIAGRYVRAAATDPDAQAYLQAVEAADGQALEFEVARAIDNFVLGCKADGIWNAIKASCILAGARTLNGALVPLVGTAPTSFNFVTGAGDYNRKTGLVGDGSTKYLDSNRNNNADLQNSNHNAVWTSVLGTAGQMIAANGNMNGTNQLSFSGFSRCRSLAGTIFPLGALSIGFAGISRATSASYAIRGSGSSGTISVASQAPESSDIVIFRRGDNANPGYFDGRLAFYSIGESLDLALLDARVTTLINAIDAAI